MASTVFRERSVEAGGHRLRCLEAGQGLPLIHLQSAGELRVTPAHDLLCRHARVVALELPEGHPPTSVLAQAIGALGLEAFNLMGTSGSARAALELALGEPQRARALVLEAPTAIRPTQRDAELERRLADLATPTLVLFGTADDTGSPAMGRVYKALLPNAHLVFVYAATHAIGADRPEAFAEVVVDFLERREAFVISRAQTVIHP